MLMTTSFLFIPTTVPMRTSFSEMLLRVSS